MYEQKSPEVAVAILEHGFALLAEHNLDCFPGTLEVAENVQAHTYGVRAYKIKANKKIRWGDWKMILDGESHHSNFKNETEWAEHYRSD